MKVPSSGPTTGGEWVPREGASWAVLAAVLLFALAVRAAAYSGFFGSDEVTYTGSAFQLLHGDWSVSNYVGANRYGINLPVAALALVFGQNEFSAALYSVLCSLAEIALVVFFGSQLLGARAGLLAGLLLASLPGHAHFAGRLMADAPLALAVTASFLCFLLGELRGSWRCWFFSGIAAGVSFWIKPAAVIYLGVFLVYPLVFWQFNRRWVWVVAGFAMMVLANSLFFWALTGKFWFIFESMRSNVNAIQADADPAIALAAPRANEPLYYYLVYLFFKVYHTWLIGPLAVMAAAVWWRTRRDLNANADRALQYIFFWAVGVLLILSLFFVSLKPLVLVLKQTNYMLMFMAPLCLLAGFTLSRLQGWTLWAGAALCIIPGILLALLLQSSVMVFTSNSKAALAFARNHPEAVVYASTNAFRAAQFSELVRPDVLTPVIHTLDELTGPSAKADRPDIPLFAIVDLNTADWGSGNLIRSLKDVPACWVSDGRLTPELDGLGLRMLAMAQRWVHAAPFPFAASLADRLSALATPGPAYVYRVAGKSCL